MSKWSFDRTEEPEMSLDIQFEGYYQKGKLYGRPEDCYPDEGEDNREITSLTIFNKTFTGKELEVFMENNPDFSKLATNWVELLDLPEDD